MTQHTGGEAQVLLHYMPIIVGSKCVTDWERKFCASMIHRNRSGRFSPSEKQLCVMRRVHEKFLADAMDDTELTEAENDER